MRSASFARRAFTLMEVLVVIALLGVVAAVVTTDFGALLDNAEKPSARESLCAALEAGRIRARDTGSPVRLVFDEASSSLRLDSAGAPERFPLGAGAGATFALPEEEGGSSRPLDAVVFHPSGYTTPALVELAVRGERARYRIEPFSATPAEVAP